MTDTYWLRLILLLFFSISEIEIINIVAYGWESGQYEVVQQWNTNSQQAWFVPATII
jgi:hypothetical protein